jgi:hypothetical protein
VAECAECGLVEWKNICELVQCMGRGGNLYSQGFVFVPCCRQVNWICLQKNCIMVNKKVIWDVNGKKKKID